jgi:hypothetical protein
VILLLAAIAQVVLPGIAAQDVRDRLGRYGRVLEVKVDAFPAIELLWHQADTVVVRMANYHAPPASLARNVAEVADAGKLDASAQVLRSGLLTLHNASLHKRGSELTGMGTVTEADLRTALPVLDSVVPVASGGGQLTLRGTATVFGVSASVDATVGPQNGALVVSPDVPFGAIATITLFSDPAVVVEGVDAKPAQDGFVAVVRARLK